MAYKPHPADRTISPAAIQRALKIRNAGSEHQILAAFMTTIDQLVSAWRRHDTARADFLRQVMEAYAVTQLEKMTAAEYSRFMLAIGHSYDRDNP